MDFEPVAQEQIIKAYKETITQPIENTLNLTAKLDEARAGKDIMEINNISSSMLYDLGFIDGAKRMVEALGIDGSFHVEAN